MNGWMTIKDSADLLGMSERTLRRHISEDKIESKLEDGRRLVYVNEEDIDTDDDMPVEAIVEHKDALLAEKESMIEQLKSEVEHLRQTSVETHRQLSESQRQLEEANTRGDTIILQLTQQLDRANLQIEDMRVKTSLWKRILTRWGR